MNKVYLIDLSYKNVDYDEDYAYTVMAKSKKGALKIIRDEVIHKKNVAYPQLSDEEWENVVDERLKNAEVTQILPDYLGIILRSNRTG